MYELKSESRTFGEGDGAIEVTVTEIDCFAQQDLWIALTQEAAPGIGGLGQLLSGGIEGLVNSQEDLSSVVPMLVEALRGLNAKKLQGLQMQTFASATAVVDGKMVSLAKADGCRAAFGPQLDLLYLAFAFAVEVIFSRFFARLRSWMSAARALVEAKLATLKETKAASASTSALS